VHKATLAAAGVEEDDRVDVAIELDDQPLPTDVVPDDLSRAIAREPKLGAAWRDLSPAHKREHVKHVIEAKQAETRARRIAKTIEALRAAQPRKPKTAKTMTGAPTLTPTPEGAAAKARRR
jgi:D-serine deaminase-like pyridoxal phosphate-dependent protein